MSKQVYTYEGSNADVKWHGGLCIHVGECGRAKGDLFVGGRKPWCQPDQAGNGMDEVVDVIERCPSGALSYHRKDGGAAESAPEHNTVMVANNGPLYVRGKLKIQEVDLNEMPGVQFRAAMCRCGLSKNKPFCDNSHNDGEFRDHGAVGESGDGATLENAGGELEIAKAKDGPLLLTGSFSILAGSGRPAWSGKKAALCRCGASENKPFCDGSHKGAGFTAE